MSRKTIPSKEIVLRLTIKDIEPEIWRKVAIDGSETLDKLHHVIQALFLWEDEHLHDFSNGKESFTHVMPDDDFENEFYEKPKNEKEFEICALLKSKSDKLLYNYDFGDGWEIEIKIVENWDAEKNDHFSLPICLAGERAAPPEDCGGIPGYFHLLQALENPSVPENRERLQWLGRPWNPETFDINAANHVLGMYLLSNEIVSEYLENVDDLDLDE